MTPEVDQKRPPQTAVGGDINNVFLGASFERIVIYICITVVLVTLIVS